MSPTFPGPVLAVATDMIRHLEGEESLPILWTRQCQTFVVSYSSSTSPLNAVFTKCKESLKDGRRLENISWRLWYKSMAVTNLVPCNDLSAETLAAEEVILNEKLYRPPTPEELPFSPPIIRDSTSNVPLSSQGKLYLKGIQYIEQFALLYNLFLSCVY